MELNSIGWLDTYPLDKIQLTVSYKKFIYGIIIGIHKKAQ